MDSDCKPLPEILADLQVLAGNAPFLALGQTIFWDEPMKAGVVMKSRRLGYGRRLIAGIHDTDYFAKLPSAGRLQGNYVAVPHNDTSTKGLWSAAAEFSALFGSETVVTKDTLQAAGLRLNTVERARPSILDEATEAWGWRGIVALGDKNVITAEVPLASLFNELMATFDWATGQSVAMLAGQGRQIAERMVAELRESIWNAGQKPGLTLSEFYQSLVRTLYQFSSHSTVEVDTTRTSELLRFNSETWSLPRFEILGLFVDEATRKEASDAYDLAIKGSSGLYELGRFGTGAIPFDLVIPGLGRGTIRLGTRGAVFSTPKPQFLSYRKPLTSLQEFAELVTSKFGSNCVLVGKAVTLIGMLAREHVFVFHEGASGYVKHSRKLHELLRGRGFELPMNPILRIRYDAWSALQVCCSWIRLPELFQRGFGTEELCAPSLASRWQSVAAEQKRLLADLGRLRRPIELIRFLDVSVGGSWNRLAEEYDGLHDRLSALKTEVEGLRGERRVLQTRLRELRELRVHAEKAKGIHWRDRIFERQPTEADLVERKRLIEEVEALIHERAAVERSLVALRHRQNEVVSAPEIKKIHERRRSIELEAELKRLRMIRGAVTLAKGLESANRRPTAWWFPLVCPDGLWFRETVETAEYYLEQL